MATYLDESIDNTGVSDPALRAILEGDFSLDRPNYTACKNIYLYHTLGRKMVNTPILMAMHKRRMITVLDSKEDSASQAFNAVWDQMKIDEQIRQAASIARIYGASGVVLFTNDDPQSIHVPLDKFNLPYQNVAFNILDPLNLSGTFTGSNSQVPTSPLFLKPHQVMIQGRPVENSRSVTIFNGEPIYLHFTESSYGYAGVSVYQNCLDSLKKFVRTQITQDYVLQKAGALILKKVQSPGIDRIKDIILRREREAAKSMRMGAVLSIGAAEDIAPLSMQHVSDAVVSMRNLIVEDIAAATEIPSKILLNGAYAGLLSNGTEDFKQSMFFVESMRNWLAPLYAYFDEIVQHVAWSKEFYEEQVRLDPDTYNGVDYKSAFAGWVKSFKATWPSLFDEPESEKVAVEKVKIEALLSSSAALGPAMDPKNRVALMAWITENLNENPLFTNPLVFDEDTLIEHFDSMKDVLLNQSQATEEKWAMGSRTPPIRGMKDI